MRIIKTFPSYLQDYIRFFYTVREDRYPSSKGQQQALIQRRLPDGTLDLVFNLGGGVALSRDGISFLDMPLVALTGLYPDRSFLSYRGPIHLVGAVLQPGAAHLFLNEVLTKLQSSTIDAALVFGNAVYKAFEEICVLPVEQEKHAVMERFLAQRLNENTEAENCRRILRAVEQVHLHRGNVNMPLLYKSCFMSERNFRRKFTEFVGMSPKKYAGIIRIKEFSKQYDLSGNAYHKILEDLGYTDQSHFSKEFSKIVGTNPGNYFYKLNGLDTGFIHLI